MTRGIERAGHHCVIALLLSWLCHHCVAMNKKGDGWGRGWGCCRCCPVVGHPSTWPSSSSIGWGCCCCHPVVSCPSVWPSSWSIGWGCHCHCPVVSHPSVIIILSLAITPHDPHHHLLSEQMGGEGGRGHCPFPTSLHHLHCPHPRHPSPMSLHCLHCTCPHQLSPTSLCHPSSHHHHPVIGHPPTRPLSSSVIWANGRGRRGRGHCPSPTSLSSSSSSSFIPYILTLSLLSCHQPFPHMTLIVIHCPGKWEASANHKVAVQCCTMLYSCHNITERSPPVQHCHNTITVATACTEQTDIQYVRIIQLLQSLFFKNFPIQLLIQLKCIYFENSNYITEEIKILNIQHTQTMSSALSLQCARWGPGHVVTLSSSSSFVVIIVFALLLQHTRWGRGEGEERMRARVHWCLYCANGGDKPSLSLLFQWHGWCHCAIIIPVILWWWWWWHRVIIIVVRSVV